MVRSLSIVTGCGRFHSSLPIHPVWLLPGRCRRMSSGSDAFPWLPAGSFVFMKDRSTAGSHRASGKSATDKTGSDRANPQLGIGFLYRELWRFADGRRSTLMWAVLLLIGSQGFKLAVPALAGTALNTLQAQGLAGLSQAAQMVALVFLAALTAYFCRTRSRGMVLRLHTMSVPYSATSATARTSCAAAKPSPCCASCKNTPSGRAAA